MNYEQANSTLREIARLIDEKSCNPYEGELRTGVDLGTANIVLVVVDKDGNLVAGASHPSTVVRDGIVVDYLGAVRTVRRLKDELEERLGVSLANAATAIPPGIIAGNVKVISNVVEGADFNLTKVIDEPTAASHVLGVRDGAVVDVGGGTTGISILKDGEVVLTADEPTGGTHMTLVLAGAYGVSVEEAETMKKDPEKEREVFPVIRPVAEKMASIVKNCLVGHEVETVHLVGGACTFSGFDDVFSKVLGLEICKPEEPLLVTPLGIALNCKGEAR